MRAAMKAIGRLALLCTLIVQPAVCAAANQKGENLIVGAWALYASRFLSPEGRIIDDTNGHMSHSEGQGYGLLMASAANDRPAFETILKWTDGELYVRGDTLAAWSWKPASSPHVTDSNNATDGDLLIAWALLRASRQWNVPQYLKRARDIADTVAEKLVVKSGYGSVLLPAVTGFQAGEQPDGPVVNLSYWIFPAIEDLQTISTSLAAARLVESGERLAKEARFGRLGLPADWTAIGGGKAALARQFPTTYGFNAIRIPLYLGWSKSAHKDLLQPYGQALAAWKGSPQIVDLDTGLTVQQLTDPGYRAMSDLLACSLGKAETAPNAEAFVPTTYYPSTLHILSIIALTERFPQCL